MTSYSKYNIVYRLQKWMDSVPGQTFLNYAYSWGASIVILGTLFKLTHLPGANLMLFFGMGTEVVVFFLSAFDRPFDKTADGMDLPSHVSEEYLDANESKVANNVAPNQTHTNGTQQLVNIAQQQVNTVQQQLILPCNKLTTLWLQRLECLMLHKVRLQWLRLHPQWLLHKRHQCWEL